MCVCVTFCFLSIVRQCRLAFLLLFSCLTVIYFPPSPFQNIKEISRFSHCLLFIFFSSYIFFSHNFPCLSLRKTFKNVAFYVKKISLERNKSNEYIIEVCVIREIMYVTIYTCNIQHTT